MTIHSNSLEPTCLTEIKKHLTKNSRKVSFLRLAMTVYNYTHVSRRQLGFLGIDRVLKHYVDHSMLKFILKLIKLKLC